MTQLSRWRWLSTPPQSQQTALQRLPRRPPAALRSRRPPLTAAARRHLTARLLLRLQQLQLKRGQVPAMPDELLRTRLYPSLQLHKAPHKHLHIYIQSGVRVQHFPCCSANPLPRDVVVFSPKALDGTRRPKRRLMQN